MLFNSVQFFVFFPVVVVLYFVCTHKIRKNLYSRILLLAASLLRLLESSISTFNFDFGCRYVDERSFNGKSRRSWNWRCN